ncbi:glycosyltransferase family 4 protein [Myxococcota bacterium]
MALPCNRGCRDDSRKYSSEEIAEGINIERIWRPRFSQSSSMGRVANSIWMNVAWIGSVLAKHRDADILLIGTDPILSVLTAGILGKLKLRCKLVHWCFDLYPEAAAADGIIDEHSIIYRSLTYLTKQAYHILDMNVDIGPCMRERLDTYNSDAAKATLIPWALSEPENALVVNTEERRVVFGQASLAMMYSGNFGRAHSYKGILRLAKSLRADGVKFAFSVRGNRENELRHAVTERDTNVAFVDFAPQDELMKRLSAADVQIVSLREEWSGLVVPSKFFGSIAVGRPVLFLGSPKSGIAKWIESYGLGWVLTPGEEANVADDLRRISKLPEELKMMSVRCHDVYTKYFSKKVVIDGWDSALRSLL